METGKLSVRLAIRDPQVINQLEEIISELDFCDMQKNGRASRADILVLETGRNSAVEFNTIKTLLHDGVVGNVFLTSAKATPDILVPALRIGARDFFQQPLVPKDIHEAFRQIYEDSSTKNAASGAEKVRYGQTFSVVGAKGGVGCTTFAVNLAVSLYNTHPTKRVALIDMNRLLGEIPIFLDLDTSFNWEQLTKNITRLDATYLRRALVQHQSGIYVMPAPTNLTGEFSPQMMLEVVEKTRASFDYIVIDSGTQLDGASFKIFGQSDRVFLLSILSLPCLVNVKRLMESLKSSAHLQPEQVNIIANRYEKKGAITLTEAEQVISNRFFSTIPNDYQLTMEAINAGKPLAVVAAKSGIEKSYRELAELVAPARPEQAGDKAKKKWFWNGLNNK